MTGLYSSKPNAKYRENISYHRIIMYEVALSAWPLWRHKLKFGLLLYVHIIAMYWIECIQYNLQKRYNIDQHSNNISASQWPLGLHPIVPARVPTPSRRSPRTPLALPLEVSDLRAPQIHLMMPEAVCRVTKHCLTSPLWPYPWSATIRNASGSSTSSSCSGGGGGSCCHCPRNLDPKTPWYLQIFSVNIWYIYIYRHRYRLSV